MSKNVLDDKWIEEPKYRNDKNQSYDKTPIILNCSCGNQFQGQRWMLESRKEIQCQDCYFDNK